MGMRYQVVTAPGCLTIRHYPPLLWPPNVASAPRWTPETLRSRNVLPTGAPRRQGMASPGSLPRPTAPRRLRRRLPGVAITTQRLEIGVVIRAAIPDRGDVIDLGRQTHPAFGLARSTQRLARKQAGSFAHPRPTAHLSLRREVQRLHPTTGQHLSSVLECAHK